MNLIKKSELIDIIQELKTFQNPKLEYEQYITDAIAVADIFFHIAFTNRDLEGNLIIDLGCGSGNLTVAAALLGARKIISVDIDKNALDILKENISKYNLNDKIEIIHADLNDVLLKDIILKTYKPLKNQDSECKIITISNPPFGVKNKGIDIKFLKQALSFSHKIYSIHLSNEKTQNFLTKKIDSIGGIIIECFTLYLLLKHTYTHHKKSKKRIKTDLYQIIPKIVQKKKLKK